MFSLILDCIVITAEAMSATGGTMKMIGDMFKGM